MHTNPDLNGGQFTRIRTVGGARYQAFLDSGYRECYTTQSLWGTPYLLQKAIRDAAGVRLFFVDVLVYDFADFPYGREQAVGYQFEAHFTTHHSQGPGFRVTLMDDDSLTPGGIETFFQRIYVAMECSPSGEERD